MIRLRNSDDAGMRAWSQSSPALVGTVAARLARGENVGDLADMDLGESAAASRGRCRRRRTGGRIEIVGLHPLAEPPRPSCGPCVTSWTCRT